MTRLTIGEALPPLSLTPDAVATIVSNIATLDLFPGLIDADYARAVGHRTVFMNTMTQLGLMNRMVLTAFPDGRIVANALTMRRPIYAGTALIVEGRIAGTGPFPGSPLSGPGVRLDITIELTSNGKVHTDGKVAVVIAGSP